MLQTRVCPAIPTGSLSYLLLDLGTQFLVLVKKCLADPTTAPDDFVKKFLAGFGDVDKDKSMAEIITVSRR